MRAWATFSLVMTCASIATGQDGGASILQYEPSVRAAGMGGASVASFWSRGEASWVHPALLGSVQGIGYDSMHTRRPFGSSDFSAERFRIGGSGLGGSFAGQPHDR
jgi:hypothetical protein